MIVVYDGSIEGFLSLVYKVYYDKLQPTSIMKEMPQTLFLDEVIEIKTQLDHSHKVLGSKSSSKFGFVLSTISS
jgi:DNA-dependent RNA polymerase auxiliary subunit epsilon